MPMAPEAMAKAALEIEAPLRASLVRDVMTYTVDLSERHVLGAMVFAALLRKYLAGFPGDREAWLSDIVRAVLQ